MCRGRFRAAAAMRRHTSPSRFACHLPSRGGFRLRRLRGQAPLEGSSKRLRGVTGLPAGSRRVQRALPRRRRYAAAHLSVTLRVPPPLKGRLWGPSPERCYRTEGFPQGFGVCRGRLSPLMARRWGPWRGAGLRSGFCGGGPRRRWRPGRRGADSPGRRSPGRPDGAAGR